MQFVKVVEYRRRQQCRCSKPSTEAVLQPSKETLPHAGVANGVTHKTLTQLRGIGIAVSDFPTLDKVSSSLVHVLSAAAYMATVDSIVPMGNNSNFLFKQEWDVNPNIDVVVPGIGGVCDAHGREGARCNPCEQVKRASRVPLLAYLSRCAPLALPQDYISICLAYYCSKLSSCTCGDRQARSHYAFAGLAIKPLTPLA